MKKIIIKAATDSVNNELNVKVLRRSDRKVIFEKTFKGDFESIDEEIDGLDSGSYKVSLSGHTGGTVKASIDGDIPVPSGEQSFTSAFNWTFYAEID